MKQSHRALPGHAPRPKPVVFVSPFAADVSSPACFSSPDETRPNKIYTIFHVFVLVGIGAGFILGLIYGAKFYGAFGGIAGALLGGYAGFVVGRLPEDWMLQKLSLDLSQASSEELRSYFHSPACQIPNLVLLELQQRGEDVCPELPAVLDLLVSEEPPRRGQGWAALSSAFPQLAEEIHDYRPGDSVVVCREKIEKLTGRNGKGANP